jgi:hypothetical protein
VDQFRNCKKDSARARTDDRTLTRSGPSAGGCTLSISSPALTTTQAGDLLVAAVDVDPSLAATQVDTVTGGGLTWTLAKKATTTTGDAEIWTAHPTGTVSGLVTTVTGTQYTDGGQITVVALAGASGVGASNAAAGTTGVPTVNVTTTAANSWVLALGDDWSNSTARTLGSGQTLMHVSGPPFFGPFRLRV